MTDITSSDQKFINAIAAEHPTELSIVDHILTAPPEPINDAPIAYDEKHPHLTSSIRSAGLIRRSQQVNEMLATHERSLQNLLDKVRGNSTGNGRDFSGEKDATPSGLVTAFDLIERRQKSCAKLLADLIDTFLIMPKWHVIVEFLVRRKYEVAANDVNGAIAVAYRTPSPVDEIEVREAVVGVYEIENDDAAHS